METAVSRDEVLFSKMGLAHMHDAILGGCNVSVPEDALKRLFVVLPVNIQQEARQWGLSDTPVRDAICQWAAGNATLVGGYIG